MGSSKLCSACRVEAITLVVAAACPELTADAIAAAVAATMTSPAAARDLAKALADGPQVLGGGAPPVVGRLVGELRARGSVLPVPACARCGRVGMELIRVGAVGLCGRCRSHQLAEACSGCGRVRVVYGRDSSGGAWCFACAPRPARCCGRCGRTAPIARRAQGDHPDICDSCFRPPAAICSSCGRRKPLPFRRFGPAGLPFVLAETITGLRPLWGRPPALGSVARRTGVRGVLPGRSQSSGNLSVLRAVPAAG